MGNPSVVFLDEPSTGMDPASRRLMWNFISSSSMARSAVILTTHSMEESEALSNRVAIMVAGRLLCIGSIQHLKNAYGKGIMVDSKFSAPAQAAVDELILSANLSNLKEMTEDDIRDAAQRLGNPSRASSFASSSMTPEAFASSWLVADAADNFLAFLNGSLFGGSAKILEKHDLDVRIQGELKGSSLADIFEKIEAQKAMYNVSQYACFQTSLEQIFNGFASQQEDYEVDIGK